MNNERARECLRRCYEEATKSPDPSTQLGAVLAFESWGVPLPTTYSHNGPVAGWDMQKEDWERPRKYSLFAHAERRVLAKAAKLGISTEGKALVCTWAACTDCAIQIVESGIKTLVRHHPPQDEATERWLESVTVGDSIMKSGGVEIVDIVGPIEDAPKILRSGEIYDPAG